MMKFGVRFRFCHSNFTPIAQFDMNSRSDVQTYLPPSKIRHNS